MGVTKMTAAVNDEIAIQLGCLLWSDNKDLISHKPSQPGLSFGQKHSSLFFHCNINKKVT